MVSEVISHYRIIKKIGAGGMGEVYLAEDTRLGRRVALKMLSSNFTGDQNQLRRFEQEARAASALNHPNIITIYEVGREGETHFIATEFVEGETLRQRLARSGVGLSELLNVSMQVAGALGAAHQAGIVHRDIKPENVMVRPDGYVKVLDFGIAKLTESFAERQTSGEAETTVSLVNTDANVILGSPSYMSPEQARGLPVDARTDIFSFGVMLYEMASGRKPFGGETANDVIVSILDREPPPLALPPGEVHAALDRIVMKALSKDREARYQTATEVLSDLGALKHRVELDREFGRSRGADPVATGQISHTAAITVKEYARDSLGLQTSRTGSITGQILSKIRRHKIAFGALALVALVAATAFLFYPRRPARLTERDTVLVADFANATGDTVFDGTLRQALAVQLEQSPFLHIFSDERIRATLRYMNRSADERLTVPVAREICQRQGLKALLTGSIKSLGTNYVISLEAINAVTGDVIARQQVEAESKEQVLRALGSAASNLREKLGESLRTVEAYDAPIEQATTSSLEALKAFSLGNEQQGRGRYLEAIPFYKRAIELDPNFALAHTRLAVAYDNTRQAELASESAARAFEMREKVSERERFFISWRYYSGATRELDRAIEVLELWKQTYPRDTEPPNTLAFYYNQTGQYERAIQEAREAIRLNPTRAQPYSNLGVALMCLNRLDEARAVYEQALAQGLDSTGYHWGLYLIGFAEGDSLLIEQRLAFLSGKSSEHESIDWQAKSSTFSGQMERARELSTRAIDLAKRGGLNEVASQFMARAALRAAVTGGCPQVKDDVAGAVALSKSNTTAIEGALALAVCGDAGQAASIIEEQSKRYPKDTLLNSVWLPTVRAIAEVRRDNPAQAVRLLEAARRYEMGYAAGYWPIYVRGLAYLKERAGVAAAAEFQKILDNRGININSNLWPLARLGLARALAMAGDNAKSRGEYEAFFNLWANADPAVPVLQEARREYSRLR
jgi:serine/threonine protein kinase/Flp pilus assembly protein TadD